MLSFIIRRLLQLIPVLFGISFITFALSFIIPGDPVRAIMGQRSDRDAELRIRQKFGLDQPWYVQYGLWIRNLVRNPGELPRYRLRVGTGNDAVRLAEGFEGEIDLALLDIKLPDMDGERVFTLLRKYRPDIRVIVCTGYSIDGPARRILDAGAQDFLQKPFRPQHLKELVRSLFQR